jgi:phosphatidylserine synthase
MEQLIINKGLDDKFGVSVVAFASAFFLVQIAASYMFLGDEGFDFLTFIILFCCGPLILAFFSKKLKSVSKTYFVLPSIAAAVACLLIYSKI